MAEHDELGREAFLEKYGYGEAKSYYVEHDGKFYDSKAIIGVAVGKQFPARGAMANSDFSGGLVVKRKLESLGFEFADNARVSARDIELVRMSREKTRYADLDDEERGAYIRITNALKACGDALVQALGPDEFKALQTSGFHLRSGVRGYIPKDLWVGVFAKENANDWVGCPQLFVIVSERGVELGFGPSTHPSGFSNSGLKMQMKMAAPKIYSLLPEPLSEQSNEIAEKLDTSGDWHFRTQTRLAPNQDDFPELASWLKYLKSEQGVRNAGGSISKYVMEGELDARDLLTDCIDMAELFAPLMNEVRISKLANVRQGPTDPDSRQFADALSAALSEFERVRTGPFLRQEPLWSHMEQTKASLEALAPIANRPYLKLVWSLGAGNWARVAWVSLLNTNVTRTTEKGVYGVFLVSQDLSRIYLNLALGVTDFMNRLGPTMGAQALIDKAGELRERVPELEPAGFTLGNAIDLASDGRLPTNYQKGTIAFVEFARDELPSDLDLENYLEALMSAYDRIANEEENEQSTADPVIEGAAEELEPYSVDQALGGLFMDRQEFERILSVWKHKKNLVLQGAPGVGKSFIARRLAYALIGAKDPKRVEAVQFHQSYGYEDFVQGYRPDGAGGFARCDGNFHRFCSEAIANPDRSFVFLIDEINRGNLSKIFGELMLLMEADKRSSEWAVQLAYAQDGEPRFYIPDNVYLLGMMNTADRSLSMVDYALRRRFAFVPMDPQFASFGFRTYLTECGIPDALIGKIIGRMSQLNDAIAADRLNLGEGYRIGHSFFVPTGQMDDAAAWYQLTIETEIKPLLEEYWFDDRDKADQWVERLLAE